MAYESKFKRPSAQQLKDIENSHRAASNLTDKYGNVKHIRRVKQRPDEVSDFIILDTVFDPNSADDGKGLPSVLEVVEYDTGVKYPGNSYNNKALLYQMSALAVGEDCPLMDGRVIKTLTKGGYFVRPQLQTNIYLSVLELNPKDKNGKPVLDKEGQPYKFFKKLLPLRNDKKSNFNAIIDILTNAYLDKDKNGKPFNSIAGVKIRLKRGSENTSATVGAPIMFQATKDDPRKVFYVRHSRAQLEKAFGHPPLLNNSGKEIYPANSSLDPYDYDKLFNLENATEEAICKKFGISVPQKQGSGDNAIFYGNEPEVDEYPIEEEHDSHTSLTAAPLHIEEDEDEGDEYRGDDNEFEDFDDDGDIPFN